MTILERVAARYKALLLCLSVFTFINVYLQYRLPYDENPGVKSRDIRGRKLSQMAIDAAASQILLRSKETMTYFSQTAFTSGHRSNFSDLLDIEPIKGDSDIWQIASNWVTGDRVVPRRAPQLQQVLKGLRWQKIVRADVSNKGTQLKLALILEGGQRALFKPKWYSRQEVITGKVYGGKDRHNGEIAAFHLSRLLGLARAPIVAGRRVHLLEEILPVASPALSRTFFKQKNETCFYGVCAYCSPSDGVCGEKHILEGAVVLWLPSSTKLVKRRHPWQRSYSDSLAKWQVNSDYCVAVRKTVVKTESQLLDFVDTAVFDFLIDNGDRHHYEATLPKERLFLIDNGKSFGNPHVDHLDILAPLIQCCRVRERLFRVLLELRGGALRLWLSALLRWGESKLVAPTLDERHLSAMDRRLNLVLTAIMICIEDRGRSNVFTSD